MFLIGRSWARHEREFILLNMGSERLLDTALYFNFRAPAVWWLWTDAAFAISLINFSACRFWTGADSRPPTFAVLCFCSWCQRLLAIVGVPCCGLILLC
jgi:hypothetical protein